MSSLLGVILGLAAVVGAFGFIIFIHEMGHFLTARSVDIRCPQFAIGFGPSLFNFRWRGTNFAVRLFPLGGYVLMNGEDPGDHRDDDPWAAAVHYYFQDQSFPAKPEDLLAVMEGFPEADRTEVWREVRDQVAYARCEEFESLRMVEGNFHDRSIPARILVISGGVIMNFLATMAMLWSLGPFVGVGSFFRVWSPVIAQTAPGTPAERAGIENGDLVLSVQGVPVETATEAFYAIGAQAGTPVDLSIRKQDGTVSELSFRPRLLIGRYSFEVEDDESLTVASTERNPDGSLKHPDWVGKKVKNLDRTRMVESVGLATKTEARTVTLELEGMKEPARIVLPEDFKSVRGQIGVLFGLSDIYFEKDLTSAVIALEDGPAKNAGLQVGDILLGVGRFEVASGNPNAPIFYGSLVEKALEITSRIEQIETLDLIVLRDGKHEKISLAKSSETSSLEKLGVSLEGRGAGDWLKAPFTMIGGMIVAPYDQLSSWLSAERSGSAIVSDMQGPLGIMQLIYNLSDNGFFQFLYFLALLNAAIGAFNLLPFPALDGARLVFLFLEGLRGKPVSPEKEARVHMVGLLVLLTFVVFVSIGDVRRLISSQIFVM